MKSLKNYRVLALLIAMGIVGFLLGVFSKILRAALSIFVTDALWASVLASIILVIITAVSTWQNRQTVKEMKEARKAEFMPIVRFQLSWFGPFFLILTSTNYGKGPALSLNIAFTYKPLNKTNLWTESTFAPTEVHVESLPEGDEKVACEKSEKIEIRGTYQDVFGKTFLIDETIDTKKFVADTDKSRFNPSAQNDVVSQILGLRGVLQVALDDMNKTLDKIAQTIEAKKS
jgi:hypothetical protein